MNWINDIKEEIKQLDVSNRKLKQFSYLVGIILLAISSWFYFRYENRNWIYITCIISIILILIGLIRAKILVGLYKIWMGIAIILGWFISRIIISIIFFMALTPISLLGRLFRKKWMDIDYSKKSDSYWIAKNEKKSIDYEKMY